MKKMNHLGEKNCDSQVQRLEHIKIFDVFEISKWFHSIREMLLFGSVKELKIGLR